MTLAHQQFIGWVELDREFVRARLISATESANFWRHVAKQLAGEDLAALQAAQDFVLNACAAAGRTRVGPKLPKIQREPQ